MKNTLLPLAAALAITAMPAVSQAQAAGPLSFNVSLTSDYRYRGISQSRLRPAVQGGLDYALPGGFYVGAWASTIRWIEDAGRIAGVDTGDAPLEVDFYAGYKADLGQGTAFDVGLLQYWYPGNKLDRIPPNEKADTTELYAALLYGPATLKYSHALTSLFGFPDSEGSGYLDLSVALDAGNGITVTPHVGHQRVRNNGDFSYTDWSIAIAKDFAGLTVSAAVVGTDAEDNGFVAYPSPSGRNLGRTGLVVAVKKAF
jgi:uncharacterized protein (TIGR02001 family)